LYPEITEQNQKLGYEYNFRHIKTLNERLLKGGVRLAGLLNSIFQSPIRSGEESARISMATSF
jgi:hypothetical protein